MPVVHLRSQIYLNMLTAFPAFDISEHVNATLFICGGSSEVKHADNIIEHVHQTRYVTHLV